MYPTLGEKCGLGPGKIETGFKGGRRKGRDAAGGTPESQVMSRVTSRATGVDKRWAFSTEAATLDTSCSSWR